MADTKCCRTCEQEKPLACFGKAKRNRDGYRNECNPCRAQRERERCQREPEKVRASRKRTAEKHADRIKAYKREYHQRHAEKIRVRSAAWARDNAERRREWGKSHREQNRDRLAADAKARYEADKEGRRRKASEWREANMARVLAVKARYYAEERDRVRALQAEWRRNNPERIQAIRRRRETKKRTVLADPGRHTPEQWAALVSQHCGRCVYCKAETIMTVDHIVPLCKGGSDRIENLQPLCRACNSRKWGMTHDEYVAYLAGDRSLRSPRGRKIRAA